MVYRKQDFKRETVDTSTTCIITLCYIVTTTVSINVPAIYIMKKLCLFGLLYLLLSVTFSLAANNDTLRRVECLLGLEFYHPESDQCFPALEQGPCDQDHWLVPDPSNTGLGGCQSMRLPDTGCEAHSLI